MTNLPTATLGRTGLEVTMLGYGAMELRGSRGPIGRDVSDESAEKLLNSVLDAGINFIDTSPDYGVSEEQIGKFISHRRDEYFLASKCGCPVGETGFAPHIFTRENVRAGVEQSLRRMKTDHLDLVQVHASPSRDVLEADETVEEMRALQQEGKVRFLGMSGTLPHLPDHIAMGCFDAFQIPYSAIEREHEQLISDAAAAGGGTIIRGGVARGIPVSLDRDYSQLPERFRNMYTQRRDTWQKAGLEDLLGGMSEMEFMLRFTMSHSDMHTTIVGTSNPEHLTQNLEAAAKGPLPDDLYRAVRERLDKNV